MTEEEITKLADEVIGPILRPHGFEHVEVRPYIDHTDEPSLAVLAHFGPDADVLAAKPFGDAMVSLKRA